MAIDNIWVFAQVADGAATPGTLELLTKARGLGGSVTAFVGGAVDAAAATLADHGAAKIYETGDLIEAPNWSPDGKWLVFNGDGRLFRISPDGSEGPVRINSWPVRGDGGP